MIVGVISGTLIADSVGLKEGSQAAKVAVIPGILGLKIAPLLIAKVVADQEAESLPPPAPQTPAIAFDPPDPNYGPVKVDSSACKMFVVRNSATAELVVDAPTLLESQSGTDVLPQFAIVGGVSFRLGPGGTQFVEVKFAPNAAGAKNASLDIKSNDPDRPTVTIGLSGTGVVPAIDGD